MKSALVLLAVSAMAGVLTAETLAPAKRADWSGEARLKDVEGAVSSPAFNRILSKDMMPVDTAKKYRVTGEFRQVAGNPATVNFGVAPFSADKKLIKPINTICYGNSFTTLMKDVKAGDTVIEVKNNSDWKVSNERKIAFNAKKDYSDLPNYDLSDGMVTKKQIDPDSGNLKITLSKPLAKDYPAGINVRLHSYGGEYLTCAGENLPLTSEWKSYSGEITGKSHGHTSKTFRDGTAFAKIVIRVNSKDRKGTVEFRNVKFEEIQ